VNVLIVSHLLPPRHTAGTETYSVRLARSLAARGRRVALFAADDDPAATGDGVRTRRCEGVETFEYPEPRIATRPDDSWENPRAERAFTTALVSFRPDVVHFQNLRFHGFGLAAAARRAGARIVWTFNDPWPLCARDGLLVDREGRFCAGPAPERCVACLRGYAFGLSPLEARWRGISDRVRRATGLDPIPLLRRFALLRRRRTTTRDSETAAALERRERARAAAFAAVDRFVAPSRFLARHFVAAGVPEAAITIAPYGVDGVRRDPATLGRGERLKVAFFGVVAPHKGAHVLAEASRLVGAAPIEFDFFGRDDQRPEYAAPLRAEFGGPLVRFHGAYAAAEAPRLLQQVDLVVTPSLWPENLPQAALEARAHGVPVVASAAGGLAEIVRDGVDGRLFPPGDAPALAGILEKLSRDREALRGYASAVEPPPTAESHAASLEAVYALPARSVHAESAT
jgi:glycosyltransferase involved in cell wall biosynthesis